MILPLSDALRALMRLPEYHRPGLKVIVATKPQIDLWKAQWLANTNQHMEDEDIELMFLAGLRIIITPNADVPYIAIPLA